MDAGVSQATLSRIINCSTNVSDEPRHKVEVAARELGVSLTDRANSRKNDTRTPKAIGLIVADLSNPYFQVVLRGVLSEARTLDYGVQIFETNEDSRYEETLFQKILDFELCGLILCASRVSAKKLLDFRNQTKLPIVLVNRYVKDRDICCLVIDYEKSLFQATTHLINLGHRKIAYLSGPAASETSKFHDLAF